MTVKINDTAIELPEKATLADALAAKSISTAGIAVAVNSVVVPKTGYDSKQLSDGDSIIIIKAFYGG